MKCPIRGVMLGLVVGAVTLPPRGWSADGFAVELAVDPGEGGAGLKALTLQLSYPKERLSLPGSGGAETVRARVRLLTADPGKDDLLMVNDDDGTATVRMVYVRQPLADTEPIAKGAFARVEFDRAGGSGADVGGIECRVAGASDQTGRNIEGVRCAAQAPRP